MSTALFTSVEAGVMYALMALGVFLSFRILDFPDLTVDGSFVTGGAVAAVSIIAGTNPFLATIYAVIAGFLAGCVTGILHAKGKINPLLSGILMMIALYSINLRIMGRSNVPLLREETVITKITAFWQGLGIDSAIQARFAKIGINFSPKTWGIIVIMFLLTFIIKLLIDLFLKTEIGLAIRAVGDNEMMIRSLSANTDNLKILGLGISNALVALSGALLAQYLGFADVGAGIGMIIIGLASVIIGEAIFGAKTIVRATLAVTLGAILYRIIVTIALRVKYLETGDMKLITAIIVVFALVIPKIVEQYREKRRRQRRLINMGNEVNLDKRGDSVVTTKTNL